MRQFLWFGTRSRVLNSNFTLRWVLARELVSKSHEQKAPDPWMVQNGQPNTRLQETPQMSGCWWQDITRICSQQGRFQQKMFTVGVRLTLLNILNVIHKNFLGLFWDDFLLFSGVSSKSKTWIGWFEHKKHLCITSEAWTEELLQLFNWIRRQVDLSFSVRKAVRSLKATVTALGGLNRSPFWPPRAIEDSVSKLVRLSSMNIYELCGYMRIIWIICFNILQELVHTLYWYCIWALVCLSIVYQLRTSIRRSNSPGWGRWTLEDVESQLWHGAAGGKWAEQQDDGTKIHHFSC